MNVCPTCGHELDQGRELTLADILDRTVASCEFAESAPQGPFFNEDSGGVLWDRTVFAPRVFQNGGTVHATITCTVIDPPDD